MPAIVLLKNFPGLTIAKNKLPIICLNRIIYFNPDELYKNKFPPAPYINSVKVEDSLLFSFHKNHFSNNQNHFEFTFTAVNLTDGYNNQYFYKLEGIDKDWVAAGKRYFANYANIPPGDYAFYVKAKNNDDVWSIKPAKYSFSIAAPYWKQWWFIVLCAAAAAGIIYFVYRQRQERIKQLEEMRSRISRDLHDDIGSTLQSISVMSEIARMKTKSLLPEIEPAIEKIGNTSREMIDKMNDIVWAVNPKNDKFGNILIHMRSFAGELLAGKDISLHFKTAPEINSVKLSMEKRKSFFLIFKEAINNAYKYSGSKNVIVKIEKSNHSMKLIIEDDGCGFDFKKEYDGNGLQNMKSRADEIDGELNISSEINKGSKIELTVHLN